MSQFPVLREQLSQNDWVDFCNLLRIQFKHNLFFALLCTISLFICRINCIFLFRPGYLKIEIKRRGLGKTVCSNTNKIPDDYYWTGRQSQQWPVSEIAAILTRSCLMPTIKLPLPRELLSWNNHWMLAHSTICKNLHKKQVLFSYG